jgi:RND family efflux transporter MFP subunit
MQQAQLSVASANNSYASQTEGATDEQIASDRASAESAAASVATAQAALDATTLVAPLDGTIVTVNAVAGVEAPSAYAIVMQTGPYEVTAAFTESDLSSIAVGQPATVTITALDQTASGTVTSIATAASAGSGGGVVTFAVTVALDSAPDGARVGMSSDVAITTASATGVVAVPAIALNGRNGTYVVRVVDATGAETPRSVEVGLVTSSLAEIKSGLAAGESVVIGSTSSTTTTTSTRGVNAGGFPGGGVIVDGGGPPVGVPGVRP